MHIECVFAWSLAGTKTINAPQRTVRAFDKCDRVRQMQTNTVIQSEKFNSVQILRGLAALLVVIGHTLQHPMDEPPPILGVLGAFGVSIFFVISGFIISYIHPRDFAPAGFLWRRIIRIVPLYWLCTIFLALCAVYLPSLFKSTSFTPYYLFSSLAFIPELVPGTVDDWRPLLKPGWSLNYEMFFYLIFILFWWCESSLRRTVFMSLALGVLIAGAFFVERNSSVTAFYLNFNLMPFLAGMWLAEMQRRGFWSDFSVNSLPVLLFFVTLSIGLLFSVDLTVLPLFIENLAYLTASVLLVVTALCTDRWVKTLSPRNVFVQIGDSSYSLYLTHMFVVGAGWAVFNRLGLGGWAFPLAVVAIIIASLVGAKISYLTIEKPFMRLGRNKAKLQYPVPQPS